MTSATVCSALVLILAATALPSARAAAAGIDTTTFVLTTPSRARDAAPGRRPHAAGPGMPSLRAPLLAAAGLALVWAVRRRPSFTPSQASSRSGAR